MSTVSFVGGAPAGSGSSIVADSQPAASANAFPATMNVGTTLIGGPLVSRDDNIVGPATAVSIAGASCVGLAVNAAGSFDPVLVQYRDRFVLTTAQWDAVAGTSGGLVAGEAYYVSATSGRLTSVPPSNPNFIGRVGVAINATTMLLLPSAPVIGA